jgi:hypothetical protein
LQALIDDLSLQIGCQQLGARRLSLGQAPRHKASNAPVDEYAQRLCGDLPCR